MFELLFDGTRGFFCLHRSDLLVRIRMIINARLVFGATIIVGGV
jgi:hypothetical protein